MPPPKPLARGQGNERFRTADSRTGAHRGQTVPYNVNGAPAGGDADTLDGHDTPYFLARANHTGTQAAATISDLAEAVQDLVGAMLANGANITVTYDDTSGQATIAVTGTLPAARMPAFTGDVTSAANTTALTLATVNLNVGSFGGAGKTITATVNGKGLVTAFAEQAIAITASQVTDFSTAVGLLNSATATKLLTARSISITGDISWTVSFDGSAAVTAAGTLATVNTNTGAWGSATQVAQITLDGKGRATAATNVSIAIPSTQVTDFTEAAQDAIGAMVDTTLVYVDATPLLTRAALTGDCTAAQGSNATTVVKINGVSLAGLVTGILKNTTGTGAPSIAVAGDFPTLNQNTTGSAATLTTSRNFSITGGGITAAAVGFNGSAAVALSASVDAGHITLARMADVATSTVFYRKTAGTGAPEVQTLTTLKADLGLTGTNSGDQTITLTGDVTGSGTGSFAATIGNNKVTFAKFVAATAASVVGATAAGNFAELTPAQARTVLALVPGTDVFKQRTITGTANQVVVTNGSGASADPTISLPSLIEAPGTVRVTSASTPASGSGLEMYFESGVSKLLSFNRTGGVDLPMEIYGSSITFEVGLAPISTVTSTGVEPSTDNTYYLGRNSSSSPKAWKGVIMKDTVSGTYYRLQVSSGVVTVVSL